MVVTKNPMAGSIDGRIRAFTSGKSPGEASKRQSFKSIFSREDAGGLCRGRGSRFLHFV
jgi:hypothetical protein